MGHKIRVVCTGCAHVFLAEEEHIRHAFTCPLCRRPLTVNVHPKRQMVPCPTCHGKGFLRQSRVDTVECPDCCGAGQVRCSETKHAGDLPGCSPALDGASSEVDEMALSFLTEQEEQSVKVVCPHCLSTLLLMSRPGQVQGLIGCLSCGWEMDAELASHGVYFTGPRGDRTNVRDFGVTATPKFVGNLELKKVQVVKLGSASWVPDVKEAHEAILACVNHANCDDVVQIAKKLITQGKQIPVLGMCSAKCDEAESYKIDYEVERRSPNASRIRSFTVQMRLRHVFRVCFCLYRCEIPPDRT
jgi:ssDNA-binding Zn-finger/Zn-ribbon topoisomerase 1